MVKDLPLYTISKLKGCPILLSSTCFAATIKQSSNIASPNQKRKQKGRII